MNPELPAPEFEPEMPCIMEHLTNLPNIPVLDVY
jgi:hypothetical protein